MFEACCPILKGNLGAKFFFPQLVLFHDMVLTAKI